MSEDSSSVQIDPISGDHFDDLLLLIDPEKKRSALESAWGQLRQQIHAHTSRPEHLDLNAIFLDIVRLEVLMYPIVRDWKQPLSNQEWEHLESQSKLLEQQQGLFKKLSLQFRRSRSDEYPEVAALFNRALATTQELRNTWSRFRREWQDYKREWEAINAQRRQVRQQQRKEGQSTEPEIKLPEYPVLPAVFRRDHWLVQRLIVRMLNVELRLRTLQKSEDDDGKHPGVKFLVGELRRVFQHTQGFELLDKIKLIQQRNAQLIQELEPAFGEAIVTPDLHDEEHPTSERKPTAPAPKVEKPAQKNRSRLWLLAGLTALLMIGGGLFFLPTNPQPPQMIKRLKFNPKGTTLTADSPENSKIKSGGLEAMLASFNLDFGIKDADPRMLRLKDAKGSERQSLINELLEEFGQEARFLFANAKGIALFWMGKLEQFANPQQARKALENLERRLKRIRALFTEVGANPKNSRVVPDLVDGEPTYALESVTAKGEPVRMYVDGEGVRLRLSNGQFMPQKLSPQAARKRLAQP